MMGAPREAETRGLGLGLERGRERSCRRGSFRPGRPRPARLAANVDGLTSSSPGLAVSKTRNLWGKTWGGKGWRWRHEFWLRQATAMHAVFAGMSGGIPRGPPARRSAGVAAGGGMGTPRSGRDRAPRYGRAGRERRGREGGRESCSGSVLIGSGRKPHVIPRGDPMFRPTRGACFFQPASEVSRGTASCPGSPFPPV